LLAIVVSNTLGTALLVGDRDFTSDSDRGTLELCFGPGPNSASAAARASSTVTAGRAGLMVLRVPPGLASLTSISRVLLRVSWIWFVLTNQIPFGATSGDALTRDTERGGLGLGTAEAASAILARPLSPTTPRPLHHRLIIATVLECQKPSPVHQPVKPESAASPDHNPRRLPLGCSSCGPGSVTACTRTARPRMHAFLAGGTVTQRDSLLRVTARG
jgi:hypothetical protein